VCEDGGGADDVDVAAGAGGAHRFLWRICGRVSLGWWKLWSYQKM
jgi:hypothetical protein